MMWMWLQRSGLVDVSKWFVCLKRIITHILGRWKSIVWSPNSISRHYSHSLFRVDIPDNNIGAAGATALVEALKEMGNLKELNLRGEFWVVVISRCDDSDTEVL